MFSKFFILIITLCSVYVGSVLITKQLLGSGLCNYTCESVTHGRSLKQFSECLKKGTNRSLDQDNNTVLEAYSRNSCPNGSIECLTTCQICGSTEKTHYDQDRDILFQFLKNGFQPTKGKLTVKIIIQETTTLNLLPFYVVIHAF